MTSIITNIDNDVFLLIKFIPYPTNAPTVISNVRNRVTHITGLRTILRLCERNEEVFSFL